MTPSLRTFSFYTPGLSQQGDILVSRKNFPVPVGGRIVSIYYNARTRLGWLITVCKMRQLNYLSPLANGLLRLRWIRLRWISLLRLSLLNSKLDVATFLFVIKKQGDK